MRIPFRLHPSSWGLSGKDYERARASYLYEGEQLLFVLRDIDHAPGTLEHTIAGYNIEHQMGRMTASDLAKNTATLQGIPWIDGDITQDVDGGLLFDFAWNDYWIEELRQNGYTGKDDDTIMRKYYAALCYNEVMKSGPDADPFLYESMKVALSRIMNEDN